MDLNLYLGSGSIPFYRRMDLGRDLSLGPAPDGEATEPNGIHEVRDLGTLYLIGAAPLPSVGGNPDSTTNDEIFGGIARNSPTLGLTADPFHMFSSPLSVYNNSAQLPGTPYLPMFEVGLQEGEDLAARHEFLDILRDSVAPTPSPSGGSGTHVSYLPFEPVLPPPDEATVTPQQSAREPMRSTFLHNEISTPVDSILRSPHLRFRTLIEYESRRREHARRHSASLVHAEESPTLIDTSFLAQERPPCDAMTNRLPESTGNDKLNASDGGNESTGNVIEDKSKTVNFECNICLDIAKEPVVTSCGHLFCWPCLYQWIHLHSVHKECPVCKGEVEMNITPIYGRGSFQTDVEETSVVGGDSGLKIPPRPRGRRFESLRQHLTRPVSRRFLEGIGDPWRRNIDGDWQNLARMDDGAWRLSRSFLGSTVTVNNERLEAMHNRLRVRRLRRVPENPNSSTNAAMVDLPTTLMTDPPVQNTSSVNQGAINHFDGSRASVSTERQSTIRNENAVDSSSVDGRISAPSASSTQPENHDIAIMGNPQNTRQFVYRTVATPYPTDQASASSTLALIQDDAGATDVLAEPNNAGSSGLLRRRRWTEASGSLDMDGGFSPTCKRRRLN